MQLRCVDVTGLELMTGNSFCVHILSELFCHKTSTHDPCFSDSITAVFQAKIGSATSGGDTVGRFATTASRNAVAGSPSGAKSVIGSQQLPRQRNSLPSRISRS